MSTKKPDYAATAAAKTLGPLLPVKYKARDADRVPILEEGQVYVTRTGTQYHTQRCDLVLSKGWRILVTMLKDVGLREPCPRCGEDPELVKHFRFERSEWQRLQEELNRLGRGVAEYLLAKGPEGVNAPGFRTMMGQYREAKAELNKLSHRVAGVFPESFKAPNW